jgi:hypothetical protein
MREREGKDLSSQIRQWIEGGCERRKELGGTGAGWRLMVVVAEEFRLKIDSRSRSKMVNNAAVFVFRFSVFRLWFWGVFEVP